MIARLDPGHVDLSGVVEVLERQRGEDLHDCAQVYVSLEGEVLLDAAIGESRAGRPLRADDVMLWYSSGKPLTTVAVLRLWERGLLGLDDPIAEYVDGWGNGKERCTVRHVLIHTGGFPMYGSRDFDTDLTSEEVLARIAATPAAWEPGTKAGYHPVTGWKVLGAVVEAVDGRPIETYLHDEILTPLGATTSSLGVARRGSGRARRSPRAGGVEGAPAPDRRGRRRAAHGAVPHRRAAQPPVARRQGGTRRVDARSGARPRRVLRGAARVRTVAARTGTVEMMGSVHRHDLRDAVFGFAANWGLGVTVDLSGNAGRRAFGHGGMASSRGFADPDCGLVAVFVCNGLPNPIAAEQRLVEVTDAIYTALGDVTARFRQ